MPDLLQLHEEIKQAPKTALIILGTEKYAAILKQLGDSLACLLGRRQVMEYPVNQYAIKGGRLERRIGSIGDDEIISSMKTRLLEILVGAGDQVL